ncbi:hypothetical protein [Noviherbaspirillum sp. ST 5-3]|uniref:hypothetical protein n=1 Tax=Noviherbaspirillum sp. ST 5-3 TaxID=3349878 RepID=UPI0039175166
MTYSFDSHGWLTAATIPGRSTEIAPPAHETTPIVGRDWPNFTGIEWITVPYVAPIAAVPDVAESETEWLIDIGPFFDRFDASGASTMSILSSVDVQVQALVKNVMARKWIDLKRADLPQMMDLLISKGLLTAEQKSYILMTPLAPEENLALRRLYFS